MKKFEIHLKEPVYDLSYLSEEVLKSRFKLLISSQKLLLFLISHVSYEKKTFGFTLHEMKFKLSEIYEVLKEKENEELKNLKEKLEVSIEEIQKNQLNISYIYPGKQKKYETYSWCAFVLSNTKTNEFNFVFSNYKIPSLIVKLKTEISSTLNEYLNLKSSYAISLYLLLKKNDFDEIKNTYQVEELKNHLQVDLNSSYKQWSAFKRFILNESMDQISRNTKYLIICKYTRVQTRVIKMRFHAFDKSDCVKLKNFLLSELKEYFKKLKLTQFYVEFSRFNFSYDTQKDVLVIDTSGASYKKKDKEKLNQFIVTSNLPEKILKKIFRSKNRFNYFIS